MSISHDLLVLKNTSVNAANVRDRYETQRFDIGFMAALSSLIFGVIGGAITAAGIFREDASTIGVGIFSLVAFAGAVALAGVHLIGKGNTTSLRETAVTTHAAYVSALNAEMGEYGIDPQTISARTTDHDSSYEFSALRNGVLSDVSVREFGNELAFMMNGERMQKPVTVTV